MTLLSKKFFLVYFLVFPKLAYNKPPPAVVRVKREQIIQENPKDIFKQHLVAESEHDAWLQGFHADCIPIAGRDDLLVLIVSRDRVVTHTEVVGAHIEDTDPTLEDLHEQQRPMPYGRYRTSIEDTRPTKRAAVQDSNDMQDDLPHLLQDLQSKQ